MAQPSLHPVILCGGSGTRLWPASTPERPKAFIALNGAHSLLQETALRVARIRGAAPPLIVVAAAHAELARAQLADVGLVRALIAEPGGRGSAPAIAAAALEIAAADPKGLALVVACDHHVPDSAAFVAGVEAAQAAAESGSIVTFGVKPTRPSDAYGYILPGAPVAGAARAVARFVEKPAMAAVGELIDAGCLWNSGNFIFRADVMLDELAAREPGLLDAVRRALAGAARHGDLIALGAAFLEAPSLAVDVAVMEKTRHAAVLPVDYAWSDLGAWDAVLETAPRDTAGNAVEGRVVVLDSQDCLIRTGAGVRVAAVGLKGIAVIVEDGRVLVCDLAHAQQVKAVGPAIEN